MDPQYATIDQLTEITNTMASLRDAILGLGQRIDGHQAQPLPVSGNTPLDSTAPPPPPPSSGPTVQQDYTVPPLPPPPVQSAPQVGAFVLHGQTETTPHSVVALAQIVDDTQARIDRIEQRIRSLHVSDGVMGWDKYDDLPVATLPVEFRIPDIERLDEAQMIMLFPLSLSGAAQRWFASLDPSRYFGSLVQALYGIEKGIARGLWQTLPLQLKEKEVEVRIQAFGCCRISTDHLLPIGRQGLLIYIRHRSQYMLHRLLIDHLYSSISSIEHRLHRGAVYTARDAFEPSISEIGDEIFMMGWDGEAPQPISLYEELDFGRYIHGQQVPRPFRLIPDEIP
ncbi:hypothetical protein CK203_099563 [Vitis vinifera]|uniref:Retrotransposon gag domain-containing protein n=1 Tax=Vitis vinifera TaxID=29760 RepID=A0A438CJ09_VITVI|nr:hypothetical protein CK203_099563 [Vitis vinifera]